VCFFRLTFFQTRWGHASEKDLLPDTLAQTPNKIVFIGPAGAPMRALGDKIGSTIIAQSAGVSCIGWNGDQLRCDYRAEGCIPKSTYDQANVNTVEKCVSECARVGFPIMIKASEGGGGKGVRKVTCETEVAAAYRQVQGEVPGSPIFVMKLAPRARHLEVQLLADQHGESSCWHLDTLNTTFFIASFKIRVTRKIYGTRKGLQ
jgi:acetyl-CoA carboxylase/biotin carboxylase 1